MMKAIFDAMVSRDTPVRVLPSVQCASGEIDRDELRKAFIVHPSMRSAPGLGGGPCDALSGGD